MANPEKRCKSLFTIQLRTLLWKNFILKRRSSILLFLELIWPLVLFIVIVAVRFQRPPVDKEPCHLQPRALPSAGLLPFLQSLMCTIENKCFNEPPDGDNTVIPLDNLINSFSDLFSDEEFVVCFDFQFCDLNKFLYLFRKK